MGRSSRNKGKRGEREVAELLRRYGFEARRDGRLDDDLDHNIAGLHIEVKRRERVNLPKWIEQAEEDAGPNRDAVVFWRRNRMPWRVDVDAEFFLALLLDALVEQSRS